MRNFIILFAEKEGTSPLIRLLNNFEQISIIHQTDVIDWEPFDIHNRGAMTLTNLERCLNIIFSKEAINFDKLNHIYTKTALSSLENIAHNGVRGFKMRFTVPRENSPFWKRLPKGFTKSSFKSMMFDVLKRNNVVVFLALRQDILKWALSKYHGDGTGNPGHLQFKLANGKIKRESIGKIHVDSARLDMIVSKCLDSHARKRRLMNDLKLAGIQTQSLIYEDFLTNKEHYFSQVLNILELKVSNEDIDLALERGAYFKKVHSDNIADFVENHEEIKEKFAHL